MLVAGSCKSWSHSHWIDGPKKQGETGNGSIEGLGLAVLLRDGFSTAYGKLIDDNEVGDATPSVPAPLLALLGLAEGSEHPSQNHDDIGNDSNQDVGTTETSKESKIKEEEWGCDAPVNVSCPVDLTVDSVVNIWDLVVFLSFGVLGIADAITGGHGEVGQEGEGGDEAGNYVEETFLLHM